MVNCLATTARYIQSASNPYFYKKDTNARLYTINKFFFITKRVRFLINPLLKTRADLYSETFANISVIDRIVNLIGSVCISAICYWVKTKLFFFIQPRKKICRKYQKKKSRKVRFQFRNDPIDVPQKIRR